jgi:hypothetical protein
MTGMVTRAGGAFRGACAVTWRTQCRATCRWSWSSDVGRRCRRLDAPAVALRPGTIPDGISTSGGGRRYMGSKSRCRTGVTLPFSSGISPPIAASTAPARAWRQWAAAQCRHRQPVAANPATAPLTEFPHQSGQFLSMVAEELVDPTLRRSRGEDSQSRRRSRGALCESCAVRLSIASAGRPRDRPPLRRLSRYGRQPAP